METPSPASASPPDNLLQLLAEVVELSPRRYTPSGSPVVDMKLAHASERHQFGGLRKLAFEIKAKAVGEVVEACSQLGLGQRFRFEGFLGPQFQGRGLVFHITRLGPAGEAFDELSLN